MFDYFSIERERGEIWAEKLPETLRGVLDHCGIILAINSRGVWFSDRYSGWEYGGTKSQMREYLAELLQELINDGEV